MSVGSGGWKDHFEVIRELGEGGAAQVYYARRRSDGQHVALKVLRAELRSNEDERKRLRREALAVTSIKSPHVCTVYECDVIGEEAYIAMEYVEGATLREVLKVHPWTRRDLGVVVGQIAESLHAAHEKGIIHRDLKPENVMLTGAEHRVKVLDFGLAKLLDLEQRSELTKLTRVGTCFGTPHYMSPEQVRGRKLDGQTDLFALGVIAYELVAGHRPWDGADAREVMMKVATAAIPRIEKPRAGLDDRRDALDAFFARALAKQPAERFPDARALAFELDRALAPQTQASVSVPDDWYSELSSAVLNIRDLLDGPAKAKAPPTKSDPQARLASAWFEPLDPDSATIVDGAERPMAPSEPIAAPTASARSSQAIRAIASAAAPSVRSSQTIRAIPNAPSTPIVVARSTPVPGSLPPAPRSRWPLGSIWTLFAVAIIFALGFAAARFFK